MISKKKFISAILAISIVAALAVGGTLAYLTSVTGTVTNTFTVGNVTITLDEADLSTADTNDRTETGNEYKLVPGSTYAKDPTVHFQPGSEASYIFVKVENGLADIEAATTIADQITTTNNWIALDNVDGVYYKQVDANNGTSAIDYQVFSQFTLRAGAGTTGDAAYNVADYKDATIKITAYAVQSDNVNSATEAWNIVKDLVAPASGNGNSTDPAVDPENP